MFRIKLILTSIVAVLVAVVAAFFKGKSEQKKDSKLEQLEDYKNTTEKLDEVVRKNDGIGPDAARDKLLKHSKRKSWSLL